MRVYIQRDERRFVQDAEVLRERTDEEYYLLENVESFMKRFFEDGWQIGILKAPDHLGGRWVKLAERLDDETAQSAIKDLLSMTQDVGVGTAVIKWEGTRFSKRIL